MSEHVRVCTKHTDVGVRRLEWNDTLSLECPLCEYNNAEAEVEVILQEAADASQAEMRAAERITERALDPLPDLGIEMPSYERGGCVSPPSCKHYEPISETSEARTIGLFCAEMDRMLGSVAKEKGYSGSSEVSDFIAQALAGNGYNLGEVVAKVVRFSKKGNEEDLLKAAAHLFLVWRRK